MVFKVILAIVSSITFAKNQDAQVMRQIETEIRENGQRLGRSIPICVGRSFTKEHHIKGWAFFLTELAKKESQLNPKYASRHPNRNHKQYGLFAITPTIASKWDCSGKTPDALKKKKGNIKCAVSLADSYFAIHRIGPVKLAPVYSAKDKKWIESDKIWSSLDYNFISQTQSKIQEFCSSLLRSSTPLVEIKGQPASN